jgi:hypothetical protein
MISSSSSPVDPAQIQKILLAREHAWADAGFLKDRQALYTLLAQDFVETNELGTFDRAGFF